MFVTDKPKSAPMIRLPRRIPRKIAQRGKKKKTPSVKAYRMRTYTIPTVSVKKKSKAWLMTVGFLPLLFRLNIRWKSRDRSIAPSVKKAYTAPDNMPTVNDATIAPSIISELTLIT